MKPALVAVLLLAAFPAVTTTAQNMEWPVEQSAPVPPDLQQLDPQDRGFAEIFVTAGLAQIEAGEIATQRASDPEIRLLGSRLAGNYRDATRRLQEMLAPMRLAPLPAEPDAEHKALADRLLQTGGADFNRLYIDSLLHDQQDLASVLEIQARTSTNAPLKKFAGDFLLLLRDDLAQTRALSRSTAGS